MLKVCSEQTPGQSQGPGQFVQAIGQKQSNFNNWSKTKMHLLERKCSIRKTLSGVPKAAVLPVEMLPLSCTALCW